MNAKTIAFLLFLSLVPSTLAQINAMALNTAQQINAPAVSALGSFHAHDPYRAQREQHRARKEEIRKLGQAIKENRLADAARFFQANPAPRHLGLASDIYSLGATFGIYRQKVTEMLDRVLNRLQSEQGNSRGEFNEVWVARGIFKDSTFGRTLPFNEVDFVQALQNLDGNAHQLQRSLDVQSHDQTVGLLHGCVRDYATVLTGLTKLHGATDRPSGTIILGHTFRFARPLYFAVLARCRAILRKVRKSKNRSLRAKFIKLRDAFRAMRRQLIEVRQSERSGSSTATTDGRRAEKAIKALEGVFKMTKDFGSVVEDMDMPTI